MVAIFTGAGAGFQRGSANILGGAGQIGTSALGRAAESVSVNAATGNLLISRQDEFLVGLGPDVGISRTYNSLQDASDGDNGDHWQQSTTRRVFGLTGTLNAAGSTVRRLSGDGSVIVYGWDAAASAYVSSDGEGAFDKLTNSAGVWTWTDGDSRVTETYAAHGTGNWRIVARTDQDGNALAFTYVGDKLDKVTTADGGWTQYVWSGNNIAQILTGYTDLETSASETLTRVRYGYDGNSRLVSVTTDLSPEDGAVVDGETYVVTYTYHGSSNRVASIAQSDGSLLAIAYDGSGRVQTLTQTVATGVSRVTALSYFTGYSQVTGPDGEVTRLHYDGAGQLTKITAPPATSGAAAQTVMFAYDADGNVIAVTDGNGNVTEYDHDANGNVILVTDANGDTIQRTYDSSNRLITELTHGTDETGPSAAHYTQYAYDGEGHLRFAVNAAGHVTEYEYTSSGQLMRTIRYPEHDYAVGPAAITEGGMESWVAGLGSLASVQITENTYDARGNLLSVTSFGSANASGVAQTAEGASTAYSTYDQAGRLLERHNGTENSESYVYDGLGRIVASSDVHGGTTTIVFNDAATTTTVTTALGYSSASVFNKAGELVSKTDSGAHTNGGTSTYLYDENGRLRSATDASGRTSYFHYDAAGRKVADVNHLGEIIEYRYDAANRLVASISYATRLGGGELATLANPANGADLSSLLPGANAEDRWSWNVYDDGGRLIQAIDDLGSTVAYEYDESGNLVRTRAYFAQLNAGQLSGFKTSPPTSQVLPASDPADAVTRMFYNEAGQLVATLDGEGYLSETMYDAAGQAVQSVAYATATLAADRASGSLETLRDYVQGASLADRISHSVYDGQGLLRFTVDALGGVSGFEYDAAGRLTKSTVYATTLDLEDFTYDAVKAALVADPADSSSWTVYDAAGRAAYTVDAGGGVTSFTYDAQGQVIKSVAYANLYDTASTPTLASMDGWAGDVAQTGDTENRLSRSFYSERGDLLYSVDPLGYVSGFTYDAEGRVLAQTSYGVAVAVNDATTLTGLETLIAGISETITVSTSYDNAGRVLTSTDGEGFVTRNVYNALGQLIDVHRADGTASAVATHYAYDGAGRLIEQISAAGSADEVAVQFAYDGLGNQIKTIDPKGSVTTYVYDRLGRLVNVTNALGGATTYQYDNFGNVVKTVGLNSAASFSYYDALNRLIASRDAEGYVTRISYNRFGEVTLSQRYSIAMNGPGETGIAYFNADDVLPSSIDPFDYAAQLQAAADALDAQADAAEAAVPGAVQAAATTAQAASDADDLVDDLEAQIAALGGGGAIDFEDERTAALADMNAWLLARRNWLIAARNDAQILRSGTNGLEYDELNSFYDMFRQEVNVATDLRSLSNTTSDLAKKAAYINQYYDNLTWQANNLGTDRAAALADPLAWLQDRQADLELWNNSFHTLTGSSRLDNTYEQIEDLWSNVTSALYDLQNNTYSTGWPSSNAQIANWYNSVQSNPNYVPNNISSTSQQTSDYRAEIIINAYFDVFDVVDYEGGLSPLQVLLSQLAQAEDDAAAAHTAADGAQSAATAAQASATSLRAQASQAQSDADAALTAAQNGTASINRDNFVLLDAATLGLSAKTYFEYDKLGRISQKIDAGGYVETYAYDAFGEVVAFSRYQDSVYSLVSAELPPDVIAAYAAAQTLQNTATDLGTQAANAASNADTLQDTADTLQGAIQPAQNLVNTRQATVNGLNTQIANHPANSAFQNPLPYLQAYRSEIAQETSTWYAAASSASPGDPLYDEYWYLYDYFLTLRNAIDAEIVNVQGGGSLSAQGRPWVMHGAGYSQYDIDYYSGLQSQLYTANQNLLSAQGALTSAQTAATNAQNQANTALANAASLQTQADNKQVEADDALAAAQNLEAAFWSSQDTSGLPEFELVELGDQAESLFEYDNRGQLVRSTDAMGFYESYAYDAYGRRTSLTAKSSSAAIAAGGTTTYEYDKRGLLVSEMLPIQSYSSAGTSLGPITKSYQYDERGNLIRSTEAVGLPEERTTEYEYDDLDRLILTRHDAVSGMTIDASTKAVSSVSGNPVETIEYDANGNIIKTVDASGARTLFLYDELNRKTGEIDAHNALTTYVYDFAGNIIRVRRHEGRLVEVQNSTGQEFSLVPDDPDGVAAQIYRLYDIALGRFPNTYEVKNWVWRFINLYGNDPNALLNICNEFIGNAELQARLDPNDNSLFVTQLYQIAFHREPTQAELDNWVGALNGGAGRGYVLSVFVNHADHKAVTGDALSNIFVSEDSISVFQSSTGLEFWTRPVNLENSTAQIFRLYDIALGRFPNQAEVNIWLSRLVNVYGNSPTALEGISSEILGDATVQSRLDPNDDIQFLTQLYRYTFAREPEQAELDTWSYALTHGTSRGFILSVFVDQPGHREITDGRLASIIHERIYCGPPVADNYRETTFTYDALGRLLTSNVMGVTTGELVGSSWSSSTAALTTTYQYDSLGNVAKVTDPNGNHTYSYYDGLGRKTDQIDGEGYHTNWSYDAEGNVLTETRYATKGFGTPSLLSPPATASDPANDRVSQYAYDLNGNRLSELRNNVAIHNGNGGTTTVTSAIYYAYNGLGQVTVKVEATGDETQYVYDAGGRLTNETRESYSSYNGQSVTPQVGYQYDGLGNLVRTTEMGGGGVSAKVTRYDYGAGGRLSKVTDAAGNAREYIYDINGRLVLEHYDRTITNTNGSTSTVREGIGYRYDAVGRVLGQAYYSKPAASWQFQSGNDYTTMAYNTFGDVVSVAFNRSASNISSKGYQQQNQYDLAGRLTATNAGDGLWKHFGYDKNGNQTLTIATGGASLAGKTFGQALAMIGQTTVNATYVEYDKRGLAVQVVEEDRELSETSTVDLTTSRTYNAFGDVTSETDALGNTTNFTYNTMGRLIEKKSPQVAIVTEAGVTQNVRPTENYYYDASGRLVAQKDANGNLTKLTLLAGTGYGGGQALVTQVIQAGGGTVTTQFDVHGNARKITDQIGRVTNQTFDAMGRVATVARQGAAVQSYSYDQLGHQVKQWNSLYGSSDAEISKYDIQGRVTGIRNYGGEVTNTAYAWNDTASTNAIGNFGGWIQSVTADGYTLTTASDIFGRRAGADYTYDAGGRLTLDKTDPNVAGELIYQYYNTGNLKSKYETSAVTREVLGGYYLDTASKGVWFSYDELGRLKTEKLTAHKVENFWFDPGAPGEDPYWESNDFGDTYQDSVATYDALGRLVSLHDNYGNFDKSWAYDANGNVRKIVGSHSGSAAVTEWYRYDALNRVTLAKGDLVSGSIVRGSDGISLTYDAASQRASSQTGSAATEYYTYNDLGLVSEVRIGGPTGTARVTSSYDTLGRLNGHIEKDAGGSVVFERFDIQYNSRSQILREKSRFHQDSGAWIYNHTVNHYNDTGHSFTASDPALITSSSSTGSSSGNLLYFSRTKSWVNGTVVSGTGTPGYGSTADNSLTDAASEHHYAWHKDKGFLETIIGTTNQYGSGSTSQEYDGAGNIVDADRTNGPWGQAENFRYATDAYGQIISREEYDDTQPYAVLGLPSTHTYRFGGREIGIVSNDGTDNVDYATLISHRDDTGSGPFRYGSNVPTNYKDFDSNHLSMAAGAQGETPGSYTVRGGETLQDVAAVVWGDVDLWYKLAEANGISGGVLQAGQRLIIPNGVVGIHNNAGTIKPYDPSRALGDINPPHVSPPKATGGNGCGVFGQILVAAVSLAVTLIAPFGPNAAIANALAGNVAGQAVGVGTGVQDGFSFKSLALAGVGAGVTVGLGELASAPGALGQVGNFLAGSGLPNQIVRGAVSSAISQGIGVATGLQDKFSWAGVAAAGVSSGVGTFVADRTQSLGQFGSDLVSNGAALIANAATRSAIEGSSFGDNILAGLPDVVGQALGRSLANAVKRSGAPENLIPDAFFEARIQQPGTQVSADPSRSRAVAVGLSVAEALAFGDSPLGAMASEGATQDPGYGQLRRTLTPGTGEVTIATGPTGSETILFTDEMQAPISAYVAGAQEGRYVLTKGGLEQAIIDGTLVGGYDARLAPQTDLGKLMAWVAAGNEVPRATITILTQTTETEQVMGSIAMHPAGTALYHVFPSPIDPKNALAILEKNNPTAAKLGTYAPLALGVTSITSKGLRKVAIGSNQTISSKLERVGNTLIPKIGGRNPINSKYAGQVHPSGVKFTDQGFPDFRPYAKAEVGIEGLTGVYGLDARLANSAIGLKSTPKGYVWHHVEDGVTMQLIPEAKHNRARHTGGAAVIRHGGFD